MPLNCLEIPTGWILPAGRLLHPGKFFGDAYQVAEVIDAHIGVVFQEFIRKEELYGKLVGFPFYAGIHEEGVGAEGVGACGVSVEEGVP